MADQWVRYEFQLWPIYHLIVSTFWLGLAVVPASVHTCFITQCSPGLFPVCSKGKTVLLQRCLAGLKRGTDQSVSHPEEAGVCLDEKWSTTNSSTYLPTPHCCGRWLSSGITTARLDVFICLMKIHLPILVPKYGFIVAHPLCCRDPWLSLPQHKAKLCGSTETFSESCECF